MADALDDQLVLARAAAGDERAFLELYERHSDRVYGFVRRLLGPDPAVDDVLQACFLALLERPSAFRGEGRLSTYLCATARNLAFRHLRTEGRFVDEGDEASPRAHEPSVLDSLLASERAAAVERAVGELPTLQREAVILFEYESLSLREIAQVSGAEVGAVKARLHRARAALRRGLAGLLPRERCEP